MSDLFPVPIDHTLRSLQREDNNLRRITERQCGRITHLSLMLEKTEETCRRLETMIEDLSDRIEAWEEGP